LLLGGWVDLNNQIKEINVKKLLYSLLTLSILFTIGCEDEAEAVDCEALATTLSEHQYNDDLNTLMTTFEFPANYVTNCNAYYDELQSIIDKGCDFGDWNADTVTAFKNEMCDTTFAI
jgi:hypothetical protein